jgi:hypothetical protein
MRRPFVKDWLAPWMLWQCIMVILMKWSRSWRSQVDNVPAIDAVGCWWMQNCFIFRHVFEVVAICKSAHLLFNMLMTDNTALMQSFEVFYILSFGEISLNNLDKRAWFCLMDMNDQHHVWTWQYWWKKQLKATRIITNQAIHTNFTVGNKGPFI